MPIVIMMSGTEMNNALVLTCNMLPPEAYSIIIESPISMNELISPSSAAKKKRKKLCVILRDPEKNPKDLSCGFMM